MPALSPELRAHFAFRISASARNASVFFSRVSCLRYVCPAMIFPVSSPSETFFFALHHVSALRCHHSWWLAIKSKNGPSSVPYGLSRGSVRWVLSRFAADRNLSYTAHFVKLRHPQNASCAHLILVHAIVSQLRSLALRRGG